MRRNNRGGNRGGQNWQNRVSGGPLLTDHLGLQDIDKELDLLKRKREIIEQQQQMLSNEFRINDYQEPQYSQSSRFDEYAQLYDNMREYEHPSRKRPIAVWEDDIPTKRFSGPTRPRSRQFSHSGPPPQRSGPTRGGYRGSNPRQANRPQSGPFKQKNQSKKDFPSRVTKASAAPINKLNTYPAAERKKLVTKAIDQTSLVTKGSDFNKLRPDCEPSKQMNGRLELALGSILKDIKAKADAEAIQPPNVMRVIKKTIRERIREVMMNQDVGSGDSIKARYREKYDEQTDLQIVSNALELQSAEMTLVKIGDPAVYFKTNMHRIMQKKLHSLLQKVEEVYLAEYGKPNIAAESPTTVVLPTAAVESGEGAEDKQIKKVVDPEETDNKDVDKKDSLDENITNTELYKALEKSLTHNMVIRLKKCVPQILKIMDIDARYVKLKNTITSETVKMLKQNEAQKSGESGSDAVAKTKSPRTPHKPIPYFAKLMGKPNLPKRQNMEKFFEEFQPKSIKKHRTVHNLLFIGFNEKESLDKFLAADGTKIGKQTLSIRVSERSTPEQRALNTSTSSEDKLIGEDLDEQISDLLTSIRRQEAEENGECDETKNNDINKAEDTDAANANDAVATIETTTDNVVDDGNVSMSILTANDTNNAPTGEEPIADPADDDASDDVIAIEGDASANDVVTIEDDVPQVEANGQENGAEDVGEVDPVSALASEAQPKAPGTPARASARLAATPSRIQTRRASKLSQNDA